MRAIAEITGDVDLGLAEGANSNESVAVISAISLSACGNPCSPSGHAIHGPGPRPNRCYITSPPYGSGSDYLQPRFATQYSLANSSNSTPHHTTSFDQEFQRGFLACSSIVRRSVARASKLACVMCQLSSAANGICGRHNRPTGSFVVSSVGSFHRGRGSCSARQPGVHPRRSHRTGCARSGRRGPRHRSSAASFRRH